MSEVYIREIGIYKSGDDFSGQELIPSGDCHFSVDEVAVYVNIKNSALQNKLDEIEPGATANSADTFLLNRANHTGTQPSTTITGLGSLAAKSSVVDADISGSISSSKISGLDTSISSAITTHEATTNHPVATTAAKGMMSPTDKNKLDGIASGATVNNADTFLLNRANHTGTQPSTTITGLGSLAAKSSVVDADISNTAAIAQSKIAGLASSLATKQDLLSPTTNLSAANLTLSGKFVRTPTSSQAIAAGSTVSFTGAVAQITSTSHVTVTTASPIAAGVEGESFVIVNIGNFSIYFNGLLFGLRPKTSATLIYVSGAWIVVSVPTSAFILVRDQIFTFGNGAIIEVNNDHTFYLYDATGTRLSQETAVAGTRVDLNRGIITPDQYNSWSRAAGYYKYSLSSTGVNLPAVTSSLTEYRCF